MPRFRAVDRALIFLSAAWLAVLLQAQILAGCPAAFLLSAALIALNAAYSLRTLTRTRRIPVALNCVQIVLFGVLNYQLYATFGTSHYRCDRAPGFFDWIEFTAAHILRAADVLDALDEWGWKIQIISHNSTAAGLLLILMHLTVDVFLIDVAMRGLRRYWPDPPRETRLAQGRREFGWFLATVALFAFLAVALRMKPIDWALWPADQLLRLVDVGDALQIFGWRLHGVDANAWTDGAAFLFRLAAGIWVARFVILWRLTVLRTWGLGIDELKNLLDDPDSAVRRGAATGLGQSGELARSAVAVLCETLHDLDPVVRQEAAWALGRIGSEARAAVPSLIDAAWLGDRELRLTAVEALASIGPAARSAGYALVCMLKVGDRSTRAAVRRALERIAPAVLRDLPPDFGQLKKKKTSVPRAVRLEKAWNHALQADRVRQRGELAVHAQLLAMRADGFFNVERGIEEIVTGLAITFPDVKRGWLVVPLLRLTAAGNLARRRTGAGLSVYVAAGKQAKLAPKTIG